MPTQPEKKIKKDQNPPDKKCNASWFNPNWHLSTTQSLTQT